MILPFKALGYLATHRVFLVVIVVVFAGLVISNKINNGNNQVAQQNQQVEYYQTIAPSVQLASQVVQTQSRVYYVFKSVEDDDTFTPVVWYSYDKDTWKRSETPLLPFSKADIKIYQR